MWLPIRIEKECPKCGDIMTSVHFIDEKRPVVHLESIDNFECITCEKEFTVEFDLEEETK